MDAIRKLPTLLLLLLLSAFSSPTFAADISGKVLLTAGPYILVDSADRRVVVRTDPATTYGNLAGIGELRQGGDRITISYNRAISEVPLATTVTKEIEYTLSADLSLPVELLALQLGKQDVVVVDPRTRTEWEMARIPGAFLLASDTDNNEIFAKDAGKQFVFYGTSAGDLRPFVAARKFIESGMGNVRVLPGGLDAWRKAGKAAVASPSTLSGYVTRSYPFRILDVSDPATVKPVLEGAEAAPVSTLTREQVFLSQRSYQLPLFLYGPEQQVREAARQILEWGYHQDGDLYVIDAANPSLPEVLRLQDVAALRSQHEIDLGEFQRLWEKDNSTQILLNVKTDRDPLPVTALHIPLEALPERLHEVPRDREIIIYCKMGIRSAVAYEILKANGFRTRFLNRQLSIDKAGKIPQ